MPEKAHFILDAYATGYAPLLAILRDRLDLNLTQVGWCAAVMAFSSSLMQPFYGFLSDRLRSRYVISFAPAITGVGLGALAWVDSFSAALLVFFAFAMQCMSTVAMVKRETGGWKIPILQFAYMGVLAYGAAFVANRTVTYFF